MKPIRCRLGLHLWLTWGVGTMVDAEWVSAEKLRRDGWASPLWDTSSGIVIYHKGQNMLF